VGAPAAPALLLFGALLLAGCGAKRLARQGEQLLADGRTTHAARCYRQACEKRPSKTGWQLDFALALLADGQPDQAVAPARLALAGAEPGADRALIEALVRTGQVDEARTLLDEALQAAPKDPLLLELSAREHLVRGQPRQAVVAMKKAVEIEPTGERMAYMAWLFARAREMPRALEAADEAMGQELTDLEALGDVGAVYLLAQSEDKRKNAAREIHTFGSDVLEQWKERAGRSQQVGDNEGALRAMTAAVALRPENGELLGLLGQMYLSLGEHDRAIRFLEASLLSPDYRNSWDRAVNIEEGGSVHTMDFQDDEAAGFCVSLAMAHAAKGNALQAGRSLRAALLIGGDTDPSRWVQAARFFLQAGDLPGAAWVAHQAYQFDQQHADTLLMLLEIYLAAGEVPKAIGFGRLAWEAMPGHPTIALTLGELYERRGDRRAARDLYRVALDAHPDVSALRLALDRVQ
jgi:tetratricopeptide (TPR) repeat protein